ncbi:hypothetical protein [Aquimarina spongiae]|uniref:Uncharacterized protein n=1 Tax=Aquimarina spongiae TaxID=570521 RepID=A0A1M6JP62_9FLAO|nr:hypothetical protein [Aquimarina spongiae]SHJ48464.1 hypothetical protein SAMN04488508_109170 [Aquimarina spongiae]
MFISVTEYIVEERRFQLDSNNCVSNDVFLQLMRRDVRVLFFLFPKKVTQLICKDTGKKIKKSLWSPEIKAAALGMKSNHNIPMWGYYSFGVIALAILIGVPIGFINELKATKQYQESFMGQSAEKKKQILQKLNTDDLIATTKNVYIIKTIDAKKVTLVSSKNSDRNNIYEELTNEAYPKNSFSGEEVSVPISKFTNCIISNTELIVNTLDN